MGKIKIGVDYYPERWEKSLWQQDVALMKRAGVKLVRIAEFAWSRMEPQEGVFCFDWLDEAVKLFEENGIGVVLCTPTNCPPLWLYEKYPETLQVLRDGRRMEPAIRGHRCYNSPVYRRYAERIITKLAQRYASAPNIAAWQIDNEIDAVMCCCDQCAEAFRKWLREKYGTMEEINRAWGNEVWSGSYSDFSQIHPPLGDRPVVQYNPAYMLDYQRFCSDSAISYVNFQRDILKRYFPDTPVTTNTWYCDYIPDFYRLFDRLDVCSYDNYPATRIPGEGYYSHAFHLDMMRGVKRKNFWIMEQLSGPGGGCWGPMSPAVRPGAIKGLALQAVAHGADAVLHFRWRTSTTGAEMFCAGLIDHSNIPGRRFAEFEDLCRTAEGLEGLAETTLKSDIALLCGFDSEYAFKLQLQPPGFYYFEQMQAFHGAFSHYGANVDIIGQDEALDGYRIVVAPALYVRSKAVEEKLHRFAENGGIVVLTARSGVKDENNNCILAPLPAGYTDMTGCWVEEYDAVGTEKGSVMMDGQRYEVTHWCDILHTETAESVAVYAEDFYAGKPAVTKNRFQKGTVYYVGAVGQPGLYRALAEKMLKEAELPVVYGLPDRVELTVREGMGKRFTFLFNNDETKKEFSFGGKRVKLAPFEMQIDS